jgi:hypothetical protein
MIHILADLQSGACEWMVYSASEVLHARLDRQAATANAAHGVHPDLAVDAAEFLWARVLRGVQSGDCCCRQPDCSGMAHEPE